MANPRCASSPFDSEITLCGDALEAFAAGFAEEEFDFARQGESITCEKCCHAISAIKVMRNTLEPRKPYL